MSLERLRSQLQTRFPELEQRCFLDETTLHISPEQVLEVALMLRDDPSFSFDTLIDICGVDYGAYGQSEWETHTATSLGFDRAVGASDEKDLPSWITERFAVVYHLLSTTHNVRLRCRVFVAGEPPMLPSVTSIWSSADWFEREAFDLFGIVFTGHPDLRRIFDRLRFYGHPFRKDFPLSGEVEVRYDATEQRVVYQPVTVQPRILVPRVVRKEKQTERSETSTVQERVKA